MKLFKKKYKRSEWFEGLLWAESKVKDFGFSDLKQYVEMCHDPDTFEADKGVEDYFKHYQKYLK